MALRVQFRRDISPTDIPEGFSGGAHWCWVWGVQEYELDDNPENRTGSITEFLLWADRSEQFVWVDASLLEPSLPDPHIRNSIQPRQGARSQGFH